MIFVGLDGTRGLGIGKGRNVPIPRVGLAVGAGAWSLASRSMGVRRFGSSTDMGGTSATSTLGGSLNLWETAWLS